MGTQKPKTHLVCLFGAGLDADLIDPWCEHYAQFNFDYYHIWLHVYGVSTHFMGNCIERFAHHDFTVNIVDKPYHNSLRAQLFAPVYSRLNPDDRIIMADSDEFQDMPLDYKDIALSHDVIEGHFVERWANGLVRYNPNSGDIFSQYPHEGMVQRSEGMRVPCMNKVLSISPLVQTCLTGSHFWRPKEGIAVEDIMVYEKDVSVYHFSFRHNYLQRMCTKPYFTPKNIHDIAEYFSVPVGSPEYCEAIRSSISNQVEVSREKGWISPALLSLAQDYGVHVD